jgi:hypothetical protein
MSHGMRATKNSRIDPAIAFQRFENAVKHIVSVSKEKVVELEKKNGHKSKNGNSRNGKH